MQGFLLPFRSVRLILRSPGLMGLSAASAVVTLAILGGLVWLLATYTGTLVTWMWARPDAWYLLGPWYLLYALTFLLLLAAGASTLPSLVLAPVQDLLSERTEKLCTGVAGTPSGWRSFFKGVWLSIFHTLGRLALLLCGYALLLPLHLVPGAGSLLWTVLASAWTITILATEHLGTTMARHLRPFGDVVRSVKGRPQLALGFGSAVYIILWVPVLNVLFLPMATVGGALLFLGLRDLESVTGGASTTGATSENGGGAEKLGNG